MSNIKINYGDGVINVPTSALSRLKSATKRDIMSLLCLLSGLDEQQTASKLDISVNEVMSAEAFWRGAGVITVDDGDEDESPAKAPENKPVESDAAPKKPKHKQAEATLPHYTTEELTAILERREELHALIEEAQNTIGKMFSTAEITKIVGMSDYLGLSSDYILSALAYCARIGKKNMRYIESFTVGLFDEGITTTEELDEYLLRQERRHGIEGDIRRMFGIGGRSLTTREKNFIENWISKLGYPTEIIQKAYDITVDSTKEPSMPYANAILESWAAEKLRTADEIDEYLKKRQKPHDTAKQFGDMSSFENDDFFRAALTSTYHKKKKDDKK